MNNAPSRIYSDIRIVYVYETFNQDILGSFNYISIIHIRFDATGYTVSSREEGSFDHGEELIKYKKLYNEGLNESEINSLMKLLSKQHKEYIEERVNNYEKEVELKKL